LSSAALPANYRLVYDIVSRSGIGKHLSSAQVYARALRRRPGIGFSTVYRGLLRLRDLGLISEIVVPGAAGATYEPSGPPHAHLRCSVCETIEDVEYAVPPKTRQRLAQRHGFQIDAERVVFEGRCRSCSAG
jgi:Fe2+ or Zn2+ uptake regulation protein